MQTRFLCLCLVTRAQQTLLTLALESHPWREKSSQTVGLLSTAFCIDFEASEHSGVSALRATGGAFIYIRREYAGRISLLLGRHISRLWALRQNVLKESQPRLVQSAPAVCTGSVFHSASADNTNSCRLPWVSEILSIWDAILILLHDSSP